jgi:hypothetical protein
LSAPVFVLKPPEAGSNQLDDSGPGKAIVRPRDHVRQPRSARISREVRYDSCGKLRLPFITKLSKITEPIEISRVNPNESAADRRAAAGLASYVGELRKCYLYAA